VTDPPSTWSGCTPTAAAGWEADLSELASAGRLQARRLTPPPEAELRLVLDDFVRQ